MHIMDGINRFLLFLNQHWTFIVVLTALAVNALRSLKSLKTKSNDKRIEAAKSFIKETILRMVTEAELDFDQWSKAGSIKRSQVISEIYASYPILEKVADQESMIKWIDTMIDESLDTLREVIATNKGQASV